MQPRERPNVDNPYDVAAGLTDDQPIYYASPRAGIADHGDRCECWLCRVYTPAVSVALAILGGMFVALILIFGR